MLKTRKSGRIPGLDGLRGIAVLAVMLFHGRFLLATGRAETFIGTHILNLGWAGVDLFFVLSGFLITGILLDSAATVTSTRQYLGVFYARRSLRIFPIYFLYLAVASLLIRVAHDPPVSLWPYLLYVSNLKPGFGANDPFLGHLWSLSIEEQFYLAWPMIVLWAGRERLVMVSAGVALGALVLRFILPLAGISGVGIYRLTPTRIDAFAIGALAVFAYRGGWLFGRRWLGVVALVLFVFAFGPLPSLGTPGKAIASTVLDCGCGLAVLVAASDPPAFFAWGPLREVGRVSYSMYLFHYAMYPAVEKIFPRSGTIRDVGLLIGVGAAAFIFAQMTDRLIEKPFNRLKDRFAYRQEATRVSAAVAE
jgi:peptidoglycan/LPS O-acetylase OafA/YrhL